MSRFEDIEQLFRNYKYLYLGNPDIPITKDTIYHDLMVYGLGNTEIRMIDNFFPGWIEQFKNKQNLNVYHTDLQSRFLQFRNDENYMGKPVKIYLSFPPDKIYGSVNKIFSYIEKRGYKTQSKVADCTRSDSVVLRMIDVNEAADVLNFINSDRELVESCRPTNPFLHREGIAGIAYDDRMSFNSILADEIRNYFQNCRNNKNYDNVSLNGFKKYLNDNYRNIFRNVENLKNIDIPYANHFGSKAQGIVNHDQIYRLILMELDENTKTSDILNTIASYKDNRKTNELVDYYDSMLKMNDYNVQNRSHFNKISLINEYIVYACNKYGKESVGEYLNSYIHRNQKAITRDNDFRNRFIANIDPISLCNIVGINPQQYVDSVVNSLNYDTKNALNYDYAYQLIESYTAYAIKKYSPYQVGGYLKSYIDGNQNAITRDNDFRNLFIQNVPSNLVLQLIGGDINLYVEEINMRYYGDPGKQY